ncbi:MAG: copper resistance protein CopC [Pseudonocardia sp.]|nr:copper resistance protein CopC [Pseudonocardia sp.]
MKTQLVIWPLVLLGLLLSAGTAFAHNVLISSDPGDGTSLSSGPANVSLHFDLPVQPSFNTVTVVGPDGGQYQNGPVKVDGSTVTVAVNSLGPAGRYTVGYRIVSEDGHPVTGSVSFVLTQAGTGHPAPATAAPAPLPNAADSPRGRGGGPLWLWVLGAVLLIAGGAALVVRIRKHSRLPG